MLILWLERCADDFVTDLPTGYTDLHSQRHCMHRWIPVDIRKPKLSYLERGSPPSLMTFFNCMAYLTRSLQCTTWSISLTDRGHRICRVSVNADPMVSAISRGASPSVLPGFVNAKEVGDCSLDAWCFDEFCEFTTEERNPPWKNGGHPSIVTSPYRSNMENLCFLGVSGDIFFKGSIGRQSICL